VNCNGCGAPKLTSDYSCKYCRREFEHPPWELDRHSYNQRLRSLAQVEANLDTTSHRLSQLNNSMNICSGMASSLMGSYFSQRANLGNRMDY
jgi:predicted amidophosphoribosyltransferase